MDEKQVRLKIGVAWEHKTKAGQSFWTGTFGNDCQIQIWQNKKREGKKDPDLNIYISEKVKIDKKVDLTSEFKNQNFDFIPNNTEIPF